MQWVAIVSYYISRETLSGGRIRRFAMAAEQKVASALNKLADRTFLDVLSPRDKSSMAYLTADFSRRIHKRTRTARKKRGLVIELH